MFAGRDGWAGSKANSTSSHVAEASGLSLMGGGGRGQVIKTGAAPPQVSQPPRCRVSDHRRQRGDRAGSWLRIVVRPALGQSWPGPGAAAQGKPDLESGSRIQNPQILARQPERQVKSQSQSLSLPTLLLPQPPPPVSQTTKGYLPCKGEGIFISFQNNLELSMLAPLQSRKPYTWGKRASPSPIPRFPH